MAVPYTFSTIPNGQTIPLQYLDANFSYIETQIGVIGSSVVTLSGGSTGLTPSVPTTGNIILAGTLNISNGGTGATTATGAITALLPSQSGQNGKFLVTDGSVASWSDIAAVTIDTPTINQPVIVGLRQQESGLTISAGSITFDCDTGNIFSFTLNANITTVTFTNVPTAGQAYSMILSVTGDGTPRTISWPGSVKWPGGSGPTPTSTAGKVDTYTLYTYDAGVTWYGFINGQDA